MKCQRLFPSLVILLFLFACKAKVGEVASERLKAPLSELQIVIFSPQIASNNLITDKRLENKLYKVFESESNTNISVERIELPDKNEESVSLEDSSTENDEVTNKLTEIIESNELDYILLFEPLKYYATSGSSSSLRILYDISLIDLEENERKWRSKTNIYIYGGAPNAKKSCKALVERWKLDGVIL